MPIYEYQCQNCSAVHELWQSMYDSDARKCPECSKPMYKLISRSSFQLKGGGWYEDGYCNKKKEKGPAKKPEDAASCTNVRNIEKPACAACG